MSQTIPQLATPFENPVTQVTEIEVTDPTHPLFGRRFPMRSISAPERGGIYVLVLYRHTFTLRIPLRAYPNNLSVQKFMALQSHEFYPISVKRIGSKRSFTPSPKIALQFNEILHFCSGQ